MEIIQQIRFLWKPLLFIVCLIPAALIVGDIFQIPGTLGATPIEEIQSHAPRRPALR